MTRRRLLQAKPAAAQVGKPDGSRDPGARPGTIRLFLCGDVMTGRGLDQVLPYPVDPALYESYVRDSRDYVRLAESRNGAIPAPVAYDYPWGPVPAILDELGVAARIINLETAVTEHPEPWPGKGINYRMHPDNAPVLDALGADICVLANNHVLDWGRTGLKDTLHALKGCGFHVAGAGRDAHDARAPAVMELGSGRRVLVFAFALPSSGVPAEWGARPKRPGVHFLPDLSPRRLRPVTDLVSAYRQEGDLVVVSVHWGGNWGYGISGETRAFARGLIDRAGVDLVHGHSSHHPKGMEIHRGRLILYGCGDFINDYEGIGGHEEYRPNLTAMYLPLIDAGNGGLVDLHVIPFRIMQMRLQETDPEDTEWLAQRLNENMPKGNAQLYVDEIASRNRRISCIRLAWEREDGTGKSVSNE